MTEYKKLPYLKPGENIGSEFYLVRVSRGIVKGTKKDGTTFSAKKTFVEVAPETGQEAVATLTFGENSSRDAVIDGLSVGSRFTLESVEVGQPSPFVRVVRL